MPNSCYVPGCKSNYTVIYTRAFRFPKDNTRKELWLKSIPRKDFKATKNSTICCKHFEDKYIIKEDILKKDGQEIPVPRSHWALTKNAVPTIFPVLPSSKQKKNLETRFDTEAADDELLNSDKIGDIQDIERNKDKYQLRDFSIVYKCHKVFFFTINFDPDPKVDISFSIDQKFNLKIYKNRILLNDTKFKFLGPNNKCDLYSKLDNLISSLLVNANQNESKDDLLSDISIKIDKISELESTKAEFLNFLNEQLKLAFSNQKRYSTDLLIFASTFFYTFPVAYRFCRDSKFFTLPNPSYIKSFNIGSLKSGDIYSNYLSHKLNLLQSDEKYVNLLLDEIYVKSPVSYETNKIKGFAQKSANSESHELTKTIQTFMVYSLHSHNKDVVGLYPVKKLDSNFFLESTVKILHILHNAGYETISIITSNNNFNRKLFESLSPNLKLEPTIPSPFDPNKKIFLLFDTVRLLKSVRNNWLNEKFQTFAFPSLESGLEVTAKFQDLRLIYDEEKDYIIKLAPTLSYKALYPSFIERQNASLAVSIFDEKNLEALERFQPNLGNHSVGTREFIDIIRKWWLIVNVQTTDKEIHKIEPLANSISSCDQKSYIYLQIFLQWLLKWEKFRPQYLKNLPKNAGKLSSQTQSALSHTTEGFILLVDYLLNNLKFQHVFLGKFQTGNLDNRFSKYPRMSSTHFLISVQQVLESKKKLKIKNVLRLKSSMHGDVLLRKFHLNFSCPSSVEHESKFTASQEDDILNSCSIVELDENTINALVFLAGYVSKKNLKNISCNSCRSLFITKKNLIADIHPNNEYLAHLDRGDLKYPSEFSINIGVSSYQIFNIIISENYERLFINSNNMKRELSTIILEKLEIEFIYDETCSCGQILFDLVEKSVETWCNIFLYNYPKNVKKKIHFSNNTNLKKRKLSSFTEQC